MFCSRLRSDRSPVAGPVNSAEASQLALLRSDAEVDAAMFPAGRTDVNGQQVDLRPVNSWMLKLGEVSTPELAEVLVATALHLFSTPPPNHYPALVCRSTRNDRTPYVDNAAAQVIPSLL